MHHGKIEYKTIFVIAMTAISGSVNSCVAQSMAPVSKSSVRQTQVITETKKPQGWKIETFSSVYQIAVARDSIVIPVYYGTSGKPLQVRKANINVSSEVGSRIREVPFRGGFIAQTPAVEVIFPDGTRECDLVYSSSEIFERDGSPCLRIDLRDSAYGLVVSSYIRVIPELDILEKWIVLKNTEKEPILIENAQSGSIWLPVDEYDLFHLAGLWGREFMLHRTRLTPGVKTIQMRDFVAHENPPWFAVTPSNQSSETQGPVWFGSLHYSGNWRLDFEKSPSGNVQIIGGINFWDTTWELKPQEEFATPKMVFGFSPEGMSGASTRMHNYIGRHVLRKKFRDALRPVLYNSWYATKFNVNEQQQL
ncbi:MAG: glycoside hydrolase family 36 N-terminal domain-containing protein, partial [Planctomycetota bacterium]